MNCLFNTQIVREQLIAFCNVTAYCVTLPNVYLSSQSIHTKKVDHGASIRPYLGESAFISFFPRRNASYSDDANHRHLEASAAKKVTDLLVNQVYVDLFSPFL